MTILRGTARILASITGLLLVYGFTFALEGMTTRIPTTAIRELAAAALFTAPWLLLFCSGLHDIVLITRKQWVIWLGAGAALSFLYYFDHYTSFSLLTKAALPPVAVGVGLIPHFVRKMGFLFTLASLAAGVAGAFVLYTLVATLLSATTQFATRTIAVLIVAFCVSGITSGACAVLEMYRRMARPACDVVGDTSTFGGSTPPLGNGVTGLAACRADSTSCSFFDYPSFDWDIPSLL